MLRTHRARGIFSVITIDIDKAFDFINSKLQDDPYQVTLATYNVD